MATLPCLSPSSMTGDLDLWCWAVSDCIGSPSRTRQQASFVRQRPFDLGF
ncbi:hypothetical protein MT378_03035 [Psychrobacter sp. 16-Bac2893]